MAKLVDALDLGSSGATHESSSLSFRKKLTIKVSNMQISIEKTSDLGREITIAIPANKINEMTSNKLKNLTKTIKLNGFRPGHVPQKLINDKYGQEARKEALNEAIDDCLNQAITDNKLTPIGDIELKELKNNDNPNPLDDIKCIFSLEVYPEIKLDNDFSKLEINTPKVEITQKDIDKGLENIRQQLAKKVTITDRAAKQGDILTVDFTGLIDGKEFDGGSSNDALVEIGSEQFINGFESGLIGAKLNKEIQLKLTFPEDYAEQTLAAKPVLFNIKIKKIEERQLAEINPELAKALGIPNNDISKINDTIKTNIEKYVNQLIIDKEREQLTELLLTTYPVKIPNKLLIEEQRHLEIMFKQRNQEQGIVIKELNSATINEISKQAHKNVHLSLLLREVIKINNLKVNNELLNNKLQEIKFLLQNKLSNNKYKNIYNNMKNSIINSMLTNTAIDFIMNQVTKKEQSLTFDELNK